jgi:hypothetical protein
MDEMGVTDGSRTSLTPQVDARLQLFDCMGNLLARRTLQGQTFLFAQVMEEKDSSDSSKPRVVVGVKSQEDLLLYGVSAASQPTVEGMSVGAAGSVHTHSSFPAVRRMGIYLKPLFSFAGLGYVQSGKQFKKFFMEDGTHQFIVIAGHTERETEER